MSAKPKLISQYQTQAQAALSNLAWTFYDSGAGEEKTIQDNLRAFEQIWLRPRVLRDVSHCSLETTLLGSSVKMPIFVAPTAFHTLAQAEGEVLSVRGAGKAGTLYVASSSSSKTLEEIAQNAVGPLWFQVYLYKDKNLNAEVIQRAEKAGYQAIVVTADMPRYGTRERFSHNFALPKDVKRVNFHGIDVSELDGSNTWEVIAWIKSLVKLPVVVKGILTAEDARLAVDYGADAIIVSNHGGRQLDSVIPSLEALPEVVSAVEGKIEVYMDGGIRRGIDVFKALALGAKAVLVGRPILWGLAVNQAEGVQDVLEILSKELELTMALMGCACLSDITSSFISKKR